MCSLEWLGRLKCRATGFDASLSSFSTSRRCSRKRTEGQVLHRERAHLKVPGFSVVLNVLLARKLPTFLSRLNEISGCFDKIAPVSGSFCSILKWLRMMAFTRLL